MLLTVAMLLGRLLREERGWNPLPDFKGIANAIGAVFDDIKGFVGAAVDFIHWFGQLAVNALADGVGAVRDLLTWFGTIAVNTLADVGGAVRDLLTWFGTVAINIVRDGFGAARDLFTWFGTLITNSIAGAAGAVQDLATWFGTLITNSIAGAAAAVRDLVTWFGTQLVNAFTATGGALKDTVTWFATTIVNVVTTSAGALLDRVQVIADAVLSAGKAVENLGQDVAEKGIDAALGHKEEILSALLLGPLGLVIDELVSQHPEAGKKLLRLVEDAVGEVGSATKDAANSTWDIIRGGGHVEPEAAPALAAAMLAAQSIIGANIHSVALLKDLIPTLPNTALPYLTAFLTKFTGWEEGIHATFSPTVHAGIGRPFEQLINKGTTTAIPGEKDLAELYGRRHIEIGDFDEILSRHGLTDTWKTAMEHSAYSPLRKFELKMIAESIDLPENVLTGFLEDARYRPEAIPFLVTALRATAMKSANGKLIAEVFAARQKGYIDAGAFGAGLSAAGVQATEQGIWQLAADAAYQNDVKGELVSAWRSAASRNAMTDDELRVGLASIGITGGKADIEVQRANVARMKKPVNDTAATEEKAVNATRSTLTTAYKLQFRKGLITADQLEGQLIFIGIPDFQARAIVELSKVESYEPPKPVRGTTPEEVSARVRADLQAAYITQFQHDAIDAETLRSDLTAIGVNDFEAASLVALEQAKKVPSPVVVAQRSADRVMKEVQAALQAAYTEQLRKDLISIDDYEAALVSIGIDPDVAHARRLLEEVKLYTVPAAVT